MTVKINKPALNLREELNELNKPSGITGESLLRADTDADARATLGIDNFEQVSVSTDGVISADGLALSDSDKATFGASDDLEIYHSGSHSIIADVGTGDLLLRGNNARLQNSDGSQTFVHGFNNGAVEISYSGNKKFQTTSSGIDVTGTATMDGLTVDANTATFSAGTNGDMKLVLEADTDNNEEGDTPKIQFKMDGGATFGHVGFVGTDGDLFTGSTANSLALGTDVNTRVQFYSNNILRQQISNNGDISFYEDTGTTAKLFWDASAERLNIGTSSSSEVLGVYKDSVNQAATQYGNSTTGEGAGNGFVVGVEGGGNGLIWNRENSFIRFGTNAAERMRIDASGKVGIGTSAPSHAIDLIGGGNYRTLRIGNISATGVKRQAIAARHYTSTEEDVNLIGMFGDATTTTVAIGGGLGATGDFNSATKLEFHTAANNTTTGTTAALTIDASQNLLVGKTSNSFSTAGFTALPSGTIQPVVDGGSTANFNRLTSDGTIVDFRKDGTTVGSISSDSGSHLIIKGAGNNAALLFNHASSRIEPYSNSATDLGRTHAKFKDLYLSGGVYLGGTGAANKLDDYEEGTWTPTLTYSGTDSGSTYYNRYGTYTKIGNIVHVRFGIRVFVEGTASTGYAAISGLPFTIAAASFADAVGTMGGTCFTATEAGIAVGGNGSTFISIRSGNGNGNDINDGDFASGSYVFGQLTYNVS